MMEILTDLLKNFLESLPYRSKMKILHTADIHLKEYNDERWEVLQKLIELGKKEKIEIFVISGDLFDKGIDAENLRPKIREIFSNNGFKIVLIPGNHDSDSYRDMYFGEDAVTLTELDTPFEYEDVKLWGMPFERVEGESILKKFHSLATKLTANTKNILLYHGELLDVFFSRNDFGDEGEERYMPVKLSYFKGINVDYVLAGHFHSKFDIRKLENNGFFVYPGSPVSITKRETGQRKVNIFEVGDPPDEYLLDSPHFEELVIDLDPLKDRDPVAIVKEHIEKVHPRAKIILTIKGYINSEKTKISESEFVKRIKEITGERCIEEHFELKDIHLILENDLFKSFINKLENTDYSEEKKRQMRDIAIKAMMETRL